MAFSQENDVILIKLEGVGEPTVYAPIASYTVKGIASFDSDDFTVNEGKVKSLISAAIINDKILEINETAETAKTNAANAVDVAENAAQVAAGAAIAASEKVSKKTTTGLFVYSHYDELQGEIPVSNSASLANSIVQRDGNRIKTSAPNEPDDVTNKYYVDVLIAALRGGETTYDTLKKIVDLIGAANGIAPLGADSKIPSTYLPSYVDDILEYDDLASFPVTGETGKIYVAKDTNLTYRWSGSAYVEISKSLAIGETSATAFRGDYGNSMYLLLSSLFGGSDIETLLAAKLNKADKYTAPIDLEYDIDNEYWVWDYSEGDNAVIEMLGSEATTDIDIQNATAGDIGVVTVKGGQLTLPENSILSSDFGYLAAIGNQYYRYTFCFDGTTFGWHRSVIGNE